MYASLPRHQGQRTRSCFDESPVARFAGFAGFVREGRFGGAPLSASGLLEFRGDLRKLSFSGFVWIVFRGRDSGNRSGVLHSALTGKFCRRARGFRLRICKEFTMQAANAWRAGAARTATRQRSRLAEDSVAVENLTLMAHHHHDHSLHSHAHSRHDTRQDRTRQDRAFAVGIALNVAFVLVETVFGLISQSVALLADAGHNLGDVLALVLAWGASLLARRGPSARFTYGLRSTSILAALINAMLLMFVTGAIAWEAMQRFAHPVPVTGWTVTVVAACGIVVNTASALLFLRDRHHDLNMRGAYLHMAADAAVSFGVVVAGLGMALAGWVWLDAAASLIISALIIAATWGLLRDSLSLALHAVPSRIEPQRILEYFYGLNGVSEVHDLHIWGMSTSETALTVHLVMPAGHPGDAFIAKIAAELAQRFHVGHATVQIETGDALYPCPLAPEHVV
jgi:cobalt-zinc-cadmium efflux system protein